MTEPVIPTQLVLSTPIGVPLYSARGLSQTWVPVAESKPAPRYTTNGELRHIGVPQMRRYESVITCRDQDAPAFGGIWTGTVVLVDCAKEMSCLTSLFATLTDDWPPSRNIIAASVRTSGLHTYYRIRAEMMVVDWDDGFDEYPHDYQWRLTLRETGSNSDVST
jgi:hypothetical protein